MLCLFLRFDIILFSISGFFFISSCILPIPLRSPFQSKITSLMSFLPRFMWAKNITFWGWYTVHFMGICYSAFVWATCEEKWTCLDISHHIYLIRHLIFRMPRYPSIIEFNMDRSLWPQQQCIIGQLTSQTLVISKNISGNFWKMNTSYLWLISAIQMYPNIFTLPHTH